MVLLGGLAIGAIVRGPSFMRLIGKEWRQDAARERDDLEAERKDLREEKDKELDRLRADLGEREQRIDNLYARINRLMRAIYYWRDLGRDYKHGWANERQRYQSWLRLHGVEQLKDMPEINELPAIIEERDAYMFTPERT